MIRPFQHNDKWILAYNVREVDSSGIRGTLSRSAERVRMTFDKCWTGEKWASTVNFAMMFDTRELAEDHLSEHNSEMVDALGK